MGTTMTALLARGDGIELAHVGDSRAYLVREGELRQITEAEAAVHPERHVITRALGSPAGIDPDFVLLPLGSAERLLLCSDGISGMIDDDRIEEVLTSVADPRDAADALVRAALEAGGRDNATAVVIDVVGLTHDDSYDSERQRESLETKLGGRP